MALDVQLVKEGELSPGKAASDSLRPTESDADAGADDGSASGSPSREPSGLYSLIKCFYSNISV